MLKKMMCLVGLIPALGFADSSTGYVDDDNAPITFQRIDSVVGIGATSIFGSLDGFDYTANGLALSAAKLFSSNVWINFNAEAAYNTNMSNGSQSFLNGDVGYAFNVGNRFQVIPNIQLQQLQVGGTMGNTTSNATVTNELLAVRLELVANRHLLLFADGAYGPSQLSLANDVNNQSGNNLSSDTIFQANAGIAWKPIFSVPWAFKGQYIYQNYNYNGFGAVNGYMLSTGIAF
ncbi:MAG: hypothetical protein KBD37_09370 [Burkholderiales bacterium]|nr:hypothetical protein [Burkholderiales bacterium]